MEPKPTNGARAITVIETVCTMGTVTQTNPKYLFSQYWGLDGKLLGIGIDIPEHVDIRK